MATSRKKKDWLSQITPQILSKMPQRRQHVLPKPGSKNAMERLQRMLHVMVRDIHTGALPIEITRSIQASGWHGEIIVRYWSTVRYTIRFFRDGMAEAEEGGKALSRSSWTQAVRELLRWLKRQLKQVGDSVDRARRMVESTYVLDDHEVLVSAKRLRASSVRGSR